MCHRMFTKFNISSCAVYQLFSVYEQFFTTSPHVNFPSPSTPSSPPRPPPSFKGPKSGSSPLPFLPPAEQQGPESILNSSTLLSSLSISALSEYKGRRNLNELLLSDNSSVTLEGRTGKNLSQKVTRVPIIEE